MPTTARPRLGTEIGVVLVLKLAGLLLIWALCFSPGHRPAADPAAVLFGSGSP
jgi:hypothetical protein